MKKTLSIALALMMVLALALTGCGGSANTSTTAATTAAATTAAQKTTAATTAAATTAAPADELVTIDWYNRDDISSVRGYQSWLDWNNEYLGEKINTNLSYHSYTAAEYEKKVVALLAAGQPCDLMYTDPYTLPYGLWVERGAFAPLDDLLEEHAKETLELLPAQLLDAARVDGVIYGLSTHKDWAMFGPLFYNETVVEKAGQLEKLENLEWSNIYDYIDIVYDVKAYCDAEMPEKNDQFLLRGCNWDHAYFAYEQFMSLAYAAIPGTNCFVEDGWDSGEIVFNKYASSEYEKKALLIKQMVDDGIMPYDWGNLSNLTSYRQDQTEIFSIGWGDCTLERDQYIEYGFTRGMVLPQRSFTFTSNLQSCMQAVNAASEHPVNAVKLLNLLYTDPTLSTAWHFGVPEKHWKTVELDGMTRVDFAGTDNEDPADRAFYVWYHAEAGSIFTSYLPLTIPADALKHLDGMNTNCDYSVNTGFMADSAPIENELAAVSSVISEYDKQLMYGMLPDVAPVLTEFNEKLIANGSEAIVAEVQAQVDAWRASK